MGRPFHVYCMSLVERLGFKTLKELFEHMDNNDIMEWSAYDLTQDTEWQEKCKKELNMERQRTQTLEDESELMKQLFMGLGG